MTTAAVPVDLPVDLPVEALVDPETGIVKRVLPITTPTGAPDAYTSVSAEVADARWLGDWPADRSSLGTTFGDPAGARIAAIAEGVERYCGNHLPAELDETLRIGTARDLASDGLAVVPLHHLPRFAPWQLARPGFPYVELTADTPTLWARCRRRDDGSPVWLPSSLVHLNWRQRRLRHLPRVHHLNYAGIATGQGLEDAVDRAVLEVVERDALELWWHLDGPTVGIEPESVPGLRDAMRGCDLDYWVVQLPSEFAPCMAALVHDRARGLYAAGFSCKNDPAEAARKAVLEAVHTWVYTDGCIEADGWVHGAIARGVLPTGLHLDHRKDRRYLDSAGEQFEHVRDLGAHVQVWLDPRAHAEHRRFTAPADGLVDIATVEHVPMHEVHERLARAGHTTYVRDLTTHDVAQTPLRVARVVVSGLVPNAPAAFAYLGCDRFSNAAVDRGWRTVAPSGPDDVTLLPPPHM